MRAAILTGGASRSIPAGPPAAQPGRRGRTSGAPPLTAADPSAPRRPVVPRRTALARAA